eukprot:11947475-Alexandrium_andersonii.AAC.1
MQPQHGRATLRSQNVQHATLCIQTCNAPTCTHNDNSAQRAAVPHQNNLTSNACAAMNCMLA